MDELALGAVYTPEWLVRRVVARSLGPLLRGLSATALLRVRVVDPACGEGAFLLGAGERLAATMLRGRAEPDPAARRRARISIVDRCLHGVDIDAAALGRARARLRCWALGESSRRVTSLERALARNLVLADALGAATRVGEELRWRVGGRPEEVVGEGGFQAVLGNPPFVEPKRYRRVLPQLEEQLRGAGFRTLGAGRVDLALPFLEVGAALLAPDGRLGFLIQTRFLRAEYGRAARRWLLERELVIEIEDYGEASLFQGRSTYTAALILGRNRSGVLKLRGFATADAARRGRPSWRQRIRAADLGEQPWCFGRAGLSELERELAERHGRLGDHDEVRIGVGLQLPWRPVYQLDPLRVETGWVTGRNGLGEEVRLERAALRPLCRNRGFYPLRVENADAFVLFPYQVRAGRVEEVSFSELSQRCPSAASYLRGRRPLLDRSTALHEGEERWHLYRYPKNLGAQAQPKVLFPTTLLETAAAVDETGDLYADNVRVLFLTAPIDRLAMAALLSSSPFSRLARERGGLGQAGWRQLNRQYLAAVPFPLEELRRRAGALAGLARQLQAQQAAALRGDLEGGDAELERAWAGLDELAADIYGLEPADRALLAAEPRRVSRSQLLRRSLAARRDDPG